MIKYFLSIFLIAVSCAPSLSTGDTSESFSSKLEYTEWKKSGFNQKQYINFLDEQVKMGVGSILATAATDFTIIEEEPSYLLVSMYEDQSPSLMALELVDEKSMRVLVWQSNIVPTTEEIKKVLTENGVLYTLKKKKNKKAS